MNSNIVTAGALILVSFYLLIEISLYFLMPRLGIAPKAEFPEISRDLLNKFNSFDPELGWEPETNSVKKKDTGHHNPDDKMEDIVTYSTDDYGSRVCQINRDTSKFNIATYGDSYCFCRGVNDNETFQHYLSKDLGVHVSNYGVGNYGIDQALLRCKRRYEEDPANIVVMAVTASSVARILSVWKHYHEFGNVLAVKPRFKFDNGDLKYITSPISKKSELLNIECKKETLRKNDYHYENWFKPRKLSYPYTRQFFRNKHNITYSFWSMLRFFEKNIGVNIPKINIENHRGASHQRTKQEIVEYHHDLYEDFSDLYVNIVGEFVEFVRDRGAKPIFVPLQQLRYAKYEQKHGPIDQKAIDMLETEYPDLIICDPRENLRSNTQNIEDLYVKRGEGGHHSPVANKYIAREIGKVIQEKL